VSVNDIRLWIYPGANPNSDASAWEPFFADISAYIRRPGNNGGQPISYSAGKQDESTNTTPGQMTLTLDNRDGRFSTDKVDGPWYGLIDTNTPIRLGVVTLSDNFNRTVGAGGWGNNWDPDGNDSTFSVDGAVAQMKVANVNTYNDIFVTGASSRDIDVTSTFIPSAAATGAAYGAGHIVRATDGANMIFSTIEFNTAGDVTVKIRNKIFSVDTTVASVNPIPSSSYTAGVGWKLRTQADGHTFRVKAWPAASSEPTAWTTTAVTEQFGSNNGLGIYVARFNGNTNSGTNNLVGVDDFLAIGLEWTGFVVSWPLDWDITGNNSWASITAAGILRRLKQGSNPIQSPLRRQLAGTPNVTGYWPLEDGADARYFSPVVPGTAVATLNGVTGAQDNSLPGGGPAPTVTAATGLIVANVKLSQGGTGFAAMFLVKLPSVPLTKTRVARIRCTRGPAPIYDLSVSTSGTVIEALAGDGSVIGTVTNSLAEDWTGWIAWQLETDNTLSGGNTTVTAIYHAVGKTVYYAQNFNISGTTLSDLYSMSLEGAQGTAFAHMWLGRNTLPFVTDAFSLVSNGYATETAIDRFLRVTKEAGITAQVTGGQVQTSEAMGVQKESTTMAVLQACADTDYAAIIERGGGLEFVPRVARWNVTQKLALSFSAGHIAKVPQPVRDDQKLKNSWTVSRLNGGEATFTDDASVARNGLWQDSAVINPADDSVLLNHAAWRVAYGTSQRLRWPSVSMNFTRNPALLDAWRQRSYGWRFGISTGLTQIRGNEPDLILEGYQCQLDPDMWTADVNASDAKIWTAAVADDTGIYGRIDMDAGQCTTTALISSTATSIPITTSAAYPKWDNTAGLWTGGVDFNVGGERVTVTSITNGAGQAQTLNVSARGVGGYAASHASGTVVHLWAPAPVAL
jgi:hypothetical protein